MSYSEEIRAKIAENEGICSVITEQSTKYIKVRVCSHQKLSLYSSWVSIEYWWAAVYQEKLNEDPFDVSSYSASYRMCSGRRVVPNSPLFSLIHYIILRVIIVLLVQNSVKTCLFVEKVLHMKIKNICEVIRSKWIRATWILTPIRVPHRTWCNWSKSCRRKWKH